MITPHCTTLLASATLKVAVFFCSATLMWRRRTARNCPILVILIVLMKRNSFCASSFVCFHTVSTLHCISLFNTGTLKFAVFWWSRKQTSLRGPGASAFPPLTIFHSLMPCRSGKTALALAIESNQKHVAAYLKSIGAPQ